MVLTYGSNPNESVRPMSGTSVTNASTLQTDFMTLLVNQLRYQNPLEPMSNDQMTAQLAQLSQLDQLEQANSFSEQLLQATQRAEAADLIGKRIIFTPDGADEPTTALVEGIDTSGSSVMVIADGQRIAMDAVQGITNG